MKLKEKQLLFARLMYTKLIPFIYDRGYEIIEGFGFRCKGCLVGKKNSNHKICLAKDLELSYNGVYVNDKENAHEVFTLFGHFWQSLHPLCRWGGEFDDAGHFSLEHRGVS